MIAIIDSCPTELRRGRIVLPCRALCSCVDHAEHIRRAGTGGLGHGALAPFRRWTAASVGSAVMEACDSIRKELLKRASKIENSPLVDAELADVTFVDGEIRMRSDPSRSLPLADVLRGANEPITSELTSIPDWKALQRYSHYVHSAVFAEVRLDEELGMLRVARVVSAVAGGRILNAKTASSQIMGAVIGGIGMALHEETVIDHRYGRFINHNFAEYHVPVNADVHAIDVTFVDCEFARPSVR
jgi:xanthine dehydrogenase YagR molybdenum-binding subunit